MICPRCGASDQQGEECRACGIVFARWRPREAKSPAPPRPPAAPRAARPPLNYRFAGAAAAAVIVVGLIWAATSGPEGADGQAAGRGGASRAGAAIGAPADPNEITDDQIKALIEECAFFRERLTVRLPKSVSAGLMGLEDPRLTLAANMGIVEFDPPFDASAASRYLPNPANRGQTSEVRLGPNAPGAISDRGDAFELDLGRRRVETLSDVQRSADKIGLFYRWTIEEPELRYFAPDHDDFMGGAELRRTADGWNARVWRNTPRSALILCEPD